MSSVIYYFSGTGNSLWVAKELATSIEDTRLVSIASVIDADFLEINEDFVGIVSPVYFNSLPEIVERFLKKINISPNSYVYSVATLGANSSSIFTHIDKLINGKLSYGKHIVFPGNYLRMYASPNNETIKSLISNAEKEIANIKKDIINKSVVPYTKENYIKKKLYSGIRNVWIRNLPKIDKGFNVNSKCTSCGLCEKICPVNNVQLVNGSPKWNGNCQDCLACINLCPVESIQIKNKTKNRKRYKNPKIKVSEFMIKN